MNEGFDQSMAHLRARLDRDIARLKQLLIVNVMVIAGGKRGFGGFANGSGSSELMRRKHQPLLKSQLEVWPRRTMDHMKLLATVNRRIAVDETSVSPFCHVSFINADDRTSPTSSAFTERGESVPFKTSVIIQGVDLSVPMDRLYRQIKAGSRGEDLEPDLDAADIDAELKRRP